ncbi:MAG TPA: hypothetical protein VGP72_29080 [Planctomycetota bacterium]|jgi:hypothetical protein
MRLRQFSAALAVGLFLCSFSVRAGEVPDPKDLPDGVDPDDVKFLKDRQDARVKVLSARKELFDNFNKMLSDLQAQRQKASELGSAKVTIDEETKDVAEPANIEAALGLKQPVRDPYEISPDDFQILDHDRWSVNQSDVHFDAPQYIVTDRIQGSKQKWFGFTFTITNSTPKKRGIVPQFVAITNKGVFNFAVGGFLPERMLADVVRRPLGYSEELRDKDLLSQGVAPLESLASLNANALDSVKGTTQFAPRATFEPGQTRWGAALWSNFSDEFTELKIVVHGLGNAHRYDEKMRRVLVLTFARNDDEFNVQRSELKLKGTKWEYLWMWDQDIAVPIPTDAKDPQIKVQPLKTPAGTDKLAFAFPFVIKNSTRANQTLAINSISFVCPMEIDIGGTKIPVEVKVVDDGRSTIYKAQFLKGLTKECPKDRFELNKTATEGSKTQLQRRTTIIEAGKALDELYAVFDEADVNWDDVKLQVETALSDKVDRKAASKATWEQIVKNVAPNKPELAGKDPGFLYDPRRQLTEEEFKNVQEQVKKNLPAALDTAKAKKTVLAYFDCTSGLSTGSFRINRCYRQLGVVQEEWLKAWEELDKAGPAAPAANQ